MPASVTLTSFAGTAPPWSLSQLDTNFSNISAQIASANNYSNYLVDTGAANAYVVTLAAGITGSLTAGLSVQFLAANSNSGASTLNVNGTGIKNITNPDGTALLANQIRAGSVVAVSYDGTQYKIASQFTGGPVAGLITANAGISIPTGQSITGAGTAAITGFATLNMQAGTVGLPSIYLGGDTTSGLYRIGANNIGVAISGANVLNVSSTGLAVTGTLSATSDTGFGVASVSGQRITSKGADATSATYAGVFLNSATTQLLLIRDDGHIFMPSLPTSSAGLSSGELWVNANVLTRVP